MLVCICFSSLEFLMKKSLIALAVLAASGVATAQSTVTLYGLADVYVGTSKEKTTVNGLSTSLRQNGVDSGGFNTSRFGLKGSEDLGGGLKANFVLEAGFDISTGAANNYVSPYNFVAPTAANPDGLVQTNAIFGRQSWVGLSGGFGEIKLGKMWTPYDEVKGSGAGAFDANIFAPANAIWLSNTYQDRPGNAIYYSTPNFSGFSAAGMYSFGENKGRNAQGLSLKAGEIGSVNVQYAGGPVAVALAYQIERQGNLTGTNPNKVKFTQLNGSYDFKAIKLLAAYGNVKNGSAKANEYQIGVDVPVGAVTLSTGIASSKVTGVGADIKSTAFGLAAKYELSKRTFVYSGLQLAKAKTTGAEAKTDTFAAGVQHKF
jgi:predicted porin